METDNIRTLRAVERSLDIIEELVESEYPVGVTELAAKLDLPTSTVYVHLQTFCERGYVIQEGKKYQPTLKYLHHGGIIRESVQVYRDGREVVQNIAKETGELVNLAVEENGLGVVIFMAKGENAAVDLASVGKYAYLHQPAYGRAILSCYPDSEIHEIIDRWGFKARTSYTITDRDELLDEIAKTRDRGYAIERNEGDVGISCIGAAITDSSGDPLGAISVTMPSNKLRSQSVEDEISQHVLNGTNIVELKMGDL